MEEFKALVIDRIEGNDNLTMTSVAISSGVSRAYLYRVLYHDAAVSMRIAKKIAAAVDLEFFLADIE